MSEQKTFLEKVHIKNYRSLRNVTLPLKPLTVLVGPNASESQMSWVPCTVSSQ